MGFIFLWVGVGCRFRFISCRLTSISIVTFAQMRAIGEKTSQTIGDWRGMRVSGRGGVEYACELEEGKGQRSAEFCSVGKAMECSVIWYEVSTWKEWKGRRKGVGGQWRCFEDVPVGVKSGWLANVLNECEQKRYEERGWGRTTTMTWAKGSESFMLKEVGCKVETRVVKCVGGWKEQKVRCMKWVVIRIKVQEYV